MPKSANDRQVGGDHYQGAELQHWDLVIMFKLDYFQAQILRYVMRWKRKNGVEDLQKAQHYVEKYIELNTIAPVTPPMTAEASAATLELQVNKAELELKLLHERLRRQKHLENNRDRDRDGSEPDEHYTNQG